MNGVLAGMAIGFAMTVRNGTGKERKPPSLAVTEVSNAVTAFAALQQKKSRHDEKTYSVVQSEKEGVGASQGRL